MQVSKAASAGYLYLKAGTKNANTTGSEAFTRQFCAPFVSIPSLVLVNRLKY